MRKLAICVVVLAVFCLAGCGNVYLVRSVCSKLA